MNKTHNPIAAYPLQWPSGWKRTPAAARTAARFGKKEREYSRHVDASGHRSSWTTSKELTIADAVTRVRKAIQQMGVRDDDIVISTNLELRLDGYPRSGQREPDDPGAVIYWLDAGNTRCMAIDRYDRVADNLAAIAATLDAMRAIERHGGAEILDRAFTGFAALPAPDDGYPRPWWDVLGVPRNADRSSAEAAYRRLRSEHHPDRGGDPEKFRAVQAAWEEYLLPRAHGVSG